LPADFWVFPMRPVHYVISRLLMALIALHVVAALYHTFILRDGLLRRMWFGRRYPKIEVERRRPDLD
jgi:cytochrome b561